MKRSTVIAISVIVLSVAIGSVLGFYFYLNSKNAEVDQYGRRIDNTSGEVSFGGAKVNTEVTLPGNASTTNIAEPAQVTPQMPVATSTPEIPALRHIYETPVSGSAFFSKEIYATTTAVTETIFTANGTSTASSTKILKPSERKFLGTTEIIEFMDRATGHIYETASSTLVLDKVSNTTITKIQEALFSTRTSLIMRDLIEGTDIIRTRYGLQQTTTPTSTEKILTTTELPQGAMQATLSPSKSRIFYTQKGLQTGVISNLDGKSVLVALSSPFREWLVQWPAEKTIVLTTKPSFVAEGFAYSLDTNSKNLRKIMGGVKGLTTLMSPDGQKILYSESANGSYNLYSTSIQTGEIRNLYFRTFPEKCVWSNREKDVVFCAVPTDIAFGDYPDAWYQGLIFFRDSVWKINTKTGETRLVANLSNLTDKPIDIINPTINTTENYMLFNNKSDLSLWGLRLIEPPKTATTTASSS